MSDVPEIPPEAAAFLAALTPEVMIAANVAGEVGRVVHQSRILGVCASGSGTGWDLPLLDALIMSVWIRTRKLTVFLQPEAPRPRRTRTEVHWSHIVDDWTPTPVESYEKLTEYRLQADQLIAHMLDRVHVSSSYDLMGPATHLVAVMDEFASHLEARGAANAAGFRQGITMAMQDLEDPARDVAFEPEFMAWPKMVRPALGSPNHRPEDAWRQRVDRMRELREAGRRVEGPPSEGASGQDPQPQ